MAGSKWKSGQTRAPYGTFKDYERTLKEVDGQTSWVREGPIQPMAIHGPVNWDQVWYYWDDVGHDFEEPLAPNSPLSADQLKQMHWYANKYGRVRDIRFVRPVGQGNNASVWLVNALHGVPVQLACKVLKTPGQDVQDSERMVTRFRVGVAEYTALCKLDHPNIIKYYDVITIPDRQTRFPFSAILTFTELCHGDLCHILDEFDALTWKMSRRWFRQIAEALAYMHEEPEGLHSIAHMDIKPENIMFKFPLEGLNRDKPTLKQHWNGITFKLGDFGTSAYLPRITNDEYDQTVTKTCGTEPFIAPEMRNWIELGIEIQAKPCDVHSLGMTLACSLISSGVFDDIGDTGRMDQFMANAARGKEGKDMASNIVRLSLLETRQQKYAEEVALKVTKNVLDKPKVAGLIWRMIRKQASKRITMQQVLEEIDKL